MESKILKNVFKFWYSRKSTESDERQIQSIDSQNWWMAWVLWLEFKELTLFSESKSAKAPHKREEFQKLINSIENINKKYKWKIDFEIWIYAWWLDRLSRNPVDSWMIQYMMQIWKIHKIICFDKIYNIEDSWIFMWMINAMSNQFILDLQKNVRRGMRDKANKWWCIQLAPNWYINNKETKEVEVDERLKPIIIEIFRLKDSWYSLRGLVKYCKDNWYKTKKWWNFSKTTIEKMLKNPFYIWFQKNEWILKKANHEIFIDIDLFNRVNWLNKRWFKKIDQSCFYLKWIIKSFYTKKNLIWVNKIKTVKSTWKTKSYIYYCTHDSEKQNKVSISQKDIITHFDNIIHLYEIKSEIKPLIWEILKKTFETFYSDLEIQRKSLNLQIIEANKKLNRLFDLVCTWIISDEKYKEENNKTTLDLEKYKTELEKISENDFILNQEGLFFVELIENLSTKRKNWDDVKKLRFIKTIVVELEIDTKKELYIEEIKLFEFIKVLNFQLGTQEGTWTLTPVRAEDFESSVSTIPPPGHKFDL